jgi:hypothetical protein
MVATVRTASTAKAIRARAAKPAGSVMVSPPVAAPIPWAAPAASRAVLQCRLAGAKIALPGRRGSVSQVWRLRLED